MKNLNFLLIVLLFSNLSCSHAQTKSNSSTKGDKKAKLQVYYFHATNRCPTCLSIESNTQKVLDTYFKTELEKGIIKYTILNSDEDKNKTVCEKYQAFGSALHFVKIANGKEIDTDMTNFAFQYSHNEPEKFIKGIKDKITDLLK